MTRVLLGPRALWLLWLCMLFTVTALSGRACAEDAGLAAGPSYPADRLWVAPLEQEGGWAAHVDVTYPEGQEADSPLVLTCLVERRSSLPQIKVRFILLEPGGQVLHEDAKVLALNEGEDTCEFHGDLTDQPPGVYRARFIWYDRPRHEVGRREFEVRRMSLAGLELRLAQAGAGLSSLQMLLEGAGE
ncbi:MAG TPA: hypothetical protein ENN80_07115, partial [Candidatus Hydrogenedentes bacterium]|nr:hypothetical protein [Candidatus Hydrogenedentota bacterium]